MTTLSDLRTIVRRSLGDWPKVMVDQITSYDGSSNPIPTGKDLPIETGSETLTVNNVAKVRGSDYTIDYDARQITFINVPAASTTIKVTYKECVYKTEQVDEGINQGRRILFPTIYQRGTTTFTVLTNVRDYDLRTAVADSWAQAIFREGHMSFKIERCDVLPIGSPDQAYLPWRRYWMEDDHTIHLWELPPAGYTFRLHIYYAFKVLQNPTDVTDVPEIAQSLLTEWAISTLALKQEPMRGRIDTANVLQSQFANPPGTMAQCVPLDAEILTRRGFRRCDEITAGEDVLAYDVSSDSNRWTPLRDVRTFASQPTVRLRSRSLDVLCTPEHKWAVRRWARSLVRTSEFPESMGHRENAIILAAPSEGGDSDLTPNEAALLGWIITDGWIRYQGKKRPDILSGIGIAQSKSENLDIIRSLVPEGTNERVTQAPPRTFPTGRTYATLPGHVFELKTTAARRLFDRAGIRGRPDVPALVTRLSHEARAAMLDAMLRADGHNKHGSGRTYVFGQKNPYVREAFQILCALEGKALGLFKRDKNDPEFVRQVMRSNRHSILKAIRIEDGPVTDVWCPTTDFGTWIMRWNGQVMITGNTSEDFLMRAERILAKLNTEPMVFVPQDMPYRWEVGLAR